MLNQNGKLAVGLLGVFAIVTLARTLVVEIKACRKQDGADTVTRLEAEFAALRQHLPPLGRVGFGMNYPESEGAKRHYLAQYALAPLIVEYPPAAPHEWIVRHLKFDAAYSPAPGETGCVLRFRNNRGCEIWRRTTPPASILTTR
jgi:hypothetical protein